VLQPSTTLATDTTRRVPWKASRRHSPDGAYGSATMTLFLSEHARRKKTRYFLDGIPREARILEIGCGQGWVAEHLRRGGWRHYVGIDLFPPADIVGDIHAWRGLGLEPQSFDVIIAFEVVEHVDCFRECYELLKPGGKLMLTSPLPAADRVMRILEAIGVNQKRTSPHDHLVHFESIPYFQQKEIKIVGLLSQWGIFTKTS